MDLGFFHLVGQQTVKNARIVIEAFSLAFSFTKNMLIKM